MHFKLILVMDQRQDGGKISVSNSSGTSLGFCLSTIVGFAPRRLETLKRPSVSPTAVPLPAATVSGFSRFLKTTRHTQSREGTDFEVELPRHNPGYNTACYQRCLLNNVDRNSWGNSTDPGCGNIIHEAGNYPYRPEYGSYGNANIRNAHRIQWESPVTGWPVPNGKGWYWLTWR